MDISRLNATVVLFTDLQKCVGQMTLVSIFFYETAYFFYSVELILKITSFAFFTKGLYSRFQKKSFREISPCDFPREISP